MDLSTFWRLFSSLSVLIPCTDMREHKRNFCPCLSMNNLVMFYVRNLTSFFEYAPLWFALTLWPIGRFRICRWTRTGTWMIGSIFHRMIRSIITIGCICGGTFIGNGRTIYTIAVTAITTSIWRMLMMKMAPAAVLPAIGAQLFFYGMLPI